MRITLALLLLVLAAVTDFTLTHAAELVVRQELKESVLVPGYQPVDGFVPDQATAIAIAVAVWAPVYGKKTSLKKPLTKQV